MRLLALLLVVAGNALAADPAPKKPIVAVLYFNTPDKSPHADDLFDMRKGLAEMVIADLVADGRFAVVERARLEEILAELSLQHSGKVDPATAAKIGKLLGAKYLVWGQLIESAVAPNQLVYGASVITVEKGEHLKLSGNHRTTVDKVFDVADAVRVDAMEGILAAEKLEAAQPKPAEKADRPRPSYKTTLKYSLALDAKDKKDPAKAKQLLTEVVKEQPDFKLAQADLLNLSN
jgi:TolB-like protein